MTRSSHVQGQLVVACYPRALNPVCFCALVFAVVVAVADTVAAAADAAAADAAAVASKQKSARGLCPGVSLKKSAL